MGIRLVTIDDNPHVSWGGRVHPVNATFQQFAAALLDLPGSPVASITSCVPVREAAVAPATRPLDPRIRVVATAAFDGIAGYLRHLPTMLRENRPILRAALADADLVWIKVPASNAPLAAALARRADVPRFGYVAGSAWDVAAAQRRGGLAAVEARAVGLAYDWAGRLASVGGDRLVVGADLDGVGVVSSLVEDGEIRDVLASPWPREDGRLRLAWAGRLAEGKGVETLLAAVAALVAEPPAERLIALDMIGDGPARAVLESEAARLGVAGHVRWHGYLADRGPYLDALAAADLFVFPSPAEGFPKVVLDAFAVGLPVVATPSGTMSNLGRERVLPVIAHEPVALASAIRVLADDPERASGLRTAGTAFVAEHTRPAEVRRLVERWRSRYPALPWGP